jgi:hypothetical protein
VALDNRVTRKKRAPTTLLQGAAVLGDTAACSYAETSTN